MKTLASLVVLLLVCVGCSGGAEGSPSASPARPTATPAPSIDAVGGIVVVDCDPGADADCQIPGLRVVQPVPVGEQVRLSVRIRNVTDETVGPVTMLVADSALEADLGEAPAGRRLQPAVRAHRERRRPRAAGRVPGADRRRQGRHATRWS